MTGPEHFAEAERLLALAKTLVRPGAQAIDAEAHFRAAEVHAALAKVALDAELAIDPRTGNALAKAPTPSARFAEGDPGTPWGRVIYGAPA